MEMFMPSEVARLVLGYLQENECIRTIRVYLTENTHLKEYVACLQQGHEYPTTIAGKSLIDILQEYCNMKASAKITENSKCSAELRQLFTRIDGSLVQLKYLVTNGHVASGALSTSLTSHTAAQKTSTRSLLLAARKENESLLNLRADERSVSHIASEILSRSVSTEVDDTLNNTAEQCTQTSCTQHNDSSAQLLEMVHLTSPLNVTRSAADGPVEAHLIPSLNTSMNSVHCASSACPTTPICKPLDLYSSPSSIVRSVLLNFGVSDLQTPVKEKYFSDDGTWKTPRRKNQVPRKRLTYSPSSSTKKRSNAVALEEPESYSTDNVDVNALIDGLLHNTALHERIAANINNVVSNTSQVASSSSSTEMVKDTNDTGQEQNQINFCEQRLVLEEPLPNQGSAQEEQMPEAVIKTIVDRTESDPMFEAFLSFFIDKQDSNSRDSQLGVESEGMPSPDTHGTPRSEGEPMPALASASSTPVPTHIGIDASKQSETPTMKSVMAVEVSVENADSSIVAPFSVGDHCAVTSQPNQFSAGKEKDDLSADQTKQSTPSRYQQYTSDSKLDLDNASSVTLDQIVAATCSGYVSQQLPSSILSHSEVPPYYTRAPSFVVSSSSNIPACETVQLLNVMPSSSAACLVLPSHSDNGSLISPAMVSAATSRACTLNTDEASATNCDSPKIHQTVAPSQTLGAFYSPNTSTSQNVKSSANGVTLAMENRAIAEPQQQDSKDKNSSDLQSISSYPIQQLTTNQKNANVTYTFMPVQNLTPFLPNASTGISEMLMLDQGTTISGSNVFQHTENSSVSQLASSTTFASNQTMHITITPGKSSSYSQFLTLSPGQLHPLLENKSSGVQQSNKSTIKMLQGSSNLCNTALEGAIKAISSLRNSKKLGLHKKSKKYDAAAVSANEISKKSTGDQDCSNATKTVNNPAKIIFTAKKLDFVRERRKAVSILKPKRSQSEVPIVQDARFTRTSMAATQVNSDGLRRPLGDATSTARNNLTKKRPAAASLLLTHSPQLQHLIQSAKLLKNVQRNGSHIRTLTFASPRKCETSSTAVEETHSTDQSARRVANKVQNSLNNQKKSSGVKSGVRGLSVSTSGTLHPSSSSLDGKGITNFYSSRKKKNATVNTSVIPQSDDQQNMPTNPFVQNISVSAESDMQLQNSINSTAQSPVAAEDIQPPKKKSRTEGSENVLSVMDVEKFLSGLQYVE